MPDEAGPEPARDPPDLERLLVTRPRAGDVEGMMALYEPHAVVDCGDGTVLRGTEAIRAYFAGTVAAGRKFAVGEQRVLGFNPGAVISGDLALTSTRLPDGTVTAESLPRTPIRGRPPPSRRHLALGHRSSPTHSAPARRPVPRANAVGSSLTSTRKCSYNVPIVGGAIHRLDV